MFISNEEGAALLHATEVKFKSEDNTNKTVQGKTTHHLKIFGSFSEAIMLERTGQ